MLHVWHLSVWNKVRSLLIGVMIVQNMVVIRCIYSLGTWKGSQDTLSHHLKPYLLFMTQNGITSILSSPSLVTISFPLNSCCTYFLLLFGLYLSLPILLNKSHILSFWLYALSRQGHATKTTCLGSVIVQADWICEYQWISPSMFGQVNVVRLPSSHFIVYKTVY